MRDQARDPGFFVLIEGHAVQSLEPTGDNRVRTTGCIECDSSAGVVAGEPVEFLLARRGHPSVRIVTVDGEEVHRCQSSFLVGPS